jgi:hypothetical protein
MQLTAMKWNNEYGHSHYIIMPLFQLYTFRSFSDAVQKEQVTGKLIILTEKRDMEP